MRVLHTSDWHLGQHFFGRTRQAEHAALCQWLVSQVCEHAIDLVLIAGDIFDTSTPPSYAREQYNQLVITLHEVGCQLVVLAGNHDSVAVLNESKALLHRLNTYVITQAGNGDELLVIEKHQKPAAIICAIPFLRPRDILSSQIGQSQQEKQLTLQQAIRDYYQALYAKAKEKQRAVGGQVPIIMTGHLTTLGASKTESVRDIYVGNLEAFPANEFPPADYIALGHIHRAQVVRNDPPIRYSGSPIALSFDESKQQKHMWLLDFSGNQLTTITPLDVPVWQPMFSVQGNLAELAQEFKQLAEHIPQGSTAWLDVLVEQDDYYTDLAERVELLVQNLPLLVLKVRRLRNSAPSWNVQDAQQLSELTPEQVFTARLQQEQFDDSQTQQLINLHAQALAAVKVDVS
ncbi:exonuclease subunit SbcD [Pseudomonas sp. F1_0610]|uniref:exonuclease subunit SbcD n=1 Tax=Pseudomonas sp. F1_0610 TaxID=3114284 RepID=UPI0039C1E00A